MVSPPVPPSRVSSPLLPFNVTLAISELMVPLFSPDQLQSGRTSLKFNNLAVIFIEEQKGRHDPVVGRFLYFAKATSTGETTGSLIKKLRLVE